jgi:hypothetical protein
MSEHIRGVGVRRGLDSRAMDFHAEAVEDRGGAEDCSEDVIPRERGSRCHSSEGSSRGHSERSGAERVEESRSCRARALWLCGGRLRAPRPLGKSISRGGRGGRGELLSGSSALHRRSAPLQPRLQKSKNFGVGIQPFAALRPFSVLPNLRASACNAVHKEQRQVHAETRRTRRTAFGGVIAAPQPPRAVGIVDGEQIEPPPESRPREQSSAPPRASATSA